MKPRSILTILNTIIGATNGSGQSAVVPHNEQQQRENNVVGDTVRPSTPSESDNAPPRRRSRIRRGSKVSKRFIFTQMNNLLAVLLVLIAYL